METRAEVPASMCRDPLRLGHLSGEIWGFHASGGTSLLASFPLLNQKRILGKTALACHAGPWQRFSGRYPHSPSRHTPAPQWPPLSPEGLLLRLRRLAQTAHCTQLRSSASQNWTQAVPNGPHSTMKDCPVVGDRMSHFLSSLWIKDEDWTIKVILALSPRFVYRSPTTRSQATRRKPLFLLCQCGNSVSQWWLARCLSQGLAEIFPCQEECVCVTESDPWKLF